MHSAPKVCASVSWLLRPLFARPSGSSLCKSFPFHIKRSINSSQNYQREVGNKVAWESERVRARGGGGGGYDSENSERARKRRGDQKKKSTYFCHDNSQRVSQRVMSMTILTHLVLAEDLLRCCSRASTETVTDNISIDTLLWASRKDCHCTYNIWNNHLYNIHEITP